jgi:hypothetical protein
MAAKVTHTVTFAGDREAILNFLTDLGTNPANKWLPIEELRSEGRASITSRQVDWLKRQVARHVKESSIEFSALPTPTSGAEEA